MINPSLLSWVARYNNLSDEKDHHSNLNNLRDLSIVIPTFSRQDYILRQIYYWASTKATIFIMDGSSEPLDDSLLLLLSKIGNIKYFHLEISYVERIKKACDHIKTRYAMCLADDDIYLKEGICKAIDFMNKNKDPLGCISKPMGLDYNFARKETMLFPYGDSLENFRVIDDNISERLEYAMASYRTATSYALFRSNEFKLIWNGIISSSCLEATEYEHAISTYIYGKLENCGSLYWLRSHECEPVDSIIDGTRRTTFDLWCKDSVYEKEYISMVERLNNKIIFNSKLNKNEASNLILNSIGHLNGKHEGLMNDSLTLRFMQYVLKILEYVPFIKKFVIYLRFTKYGKKIRSMIRIVTRKGDSLQSKNHQSILLSNNEALKKVVEFVNQFHQLK